MTEKTPEKGARKRLSNDWKITLLNDPEGTAYGPDNNPKRSGTESAKRFALYRNGMTVGQAKEAGVTSGDISWDAKKGFIEVAA